MNRKTGNIFDGIVGVRIDKEVQEESEHFYTCNICGQSVDMRHLGEVFYHEEPEHEPLPNDS
jgi:hypothetical protein